MFFFLNIAPKLKHKIMNAKVKEGSGKRTNTTRKIIIFILLILFILLIFINNIHIINIY